MPNEVKNKLKEELNKINLKLQLLDRIESKLLKMKNLAQRVLEEDLTKEEIEIINKEVQKLRSEVELLGREPTQLS